jgi:hypothetical protein
MCLLRSCLGRDRQRPSLSQLQTPPAMLHADDEDFTDSADKGYCNNNEEAG